MRFVARHRLLVALAVAVGGWQMCHHAATVVQILFATRTLGPVGAGGRPELHGHGRRHDHRERVRQPHQPAHRPGARAWSLGFAVCGAGWLLLAVAPANAWGVAAFALMLMLFSTGAVLIFINFLALRQAVTPTPLLGRMTSTMRWLILIPAGPGALLGGWLGEHHGLRSSLAFAGGGALLLALLAWRWAVIRNVRALPVPENVDDSLGVEALVRPRTVMDAT